MKKEFNKVDKENQTAKIKYITAIITLIAVIVPILWIKDIEPNKDTPSTNPSNNHNDNSVSHTEGPVVEESIYTYRINFSEKLDVSAVIISTNKDTYDTELASYILKEYKRKGANIHPGIINSARIDSKTHEKFSELNITPLLSNKNLDLLVYGQLLEWTKHTDKDIYVTNIQLKLSFLNIENPSNSSVQTYNGRGTDGDRSRSILIAKINLKNNINEKLPY